MNRNKALINLIMCALFAALAFTATNIRIPLPSGGMIHLGNFVVVIAALFCGGIVGGVAGGIGCGLFDLIIYSDPVGFVKYFILKLIMGLIVGYLFRMIINHKIKLKFNIILTVLSVIFIFLSTTVIVLYINEELNLSSKITNQGFYIGLVSGFGYLFALILMLAVWIMKKYSKVQKCITFVVGISVVVNIVLEFLWSLFENFFYLNLSFEASLIKGVSTMPSCILTGVLSVVLATIVFMPIYEATKKSAIYENLKIDEYEEV